MGEITFLIGGARSGKSTLAVELGGRFAGDVVFVATAEAFDDDMRGRIDRHRLERPGWPTIEEPVDLAAALADAPDNAMVIVDCITVWLGNLFARGEDPASFVDRCARLVDAMRRRGGPAVVISNEVGLGVHPETPMGRAYRDELGRMNQMIAAAADRAVLLVAGRALRLDPLWDVLD